jgi:uroporphyrinogen-III synthase
MKRVLVLRPEPGASATVERARRLGLDAVAAPLFKIEPVEWSTPDPSNFDGLLLTSANAIRCGGEQLRALRELPAYVVGEATATAARNAGLEVAVSGDSGVDALLALLWEDLRLLHPCGADRRQPIQPRQKITPVVVYLSREVEPPELSSEADCVVLVHSSRAGARFAELMQNRTSITLAAISNAAAEAAGTGWAGIHVAKAPTDDALLALAATLCNKPEPK